MASASAQGKNRERPHESGGALYAWRRSLGINRKTFSGLAALSERTLATYEQQKELPESVRPKIIEAIRLVKALSELIPRDRLTDWLNTANSGFGGRRPLALIAEGERDLIWEMIHQTRQGVFG